MHISLHDLVTKVEEVSSLISTEFGKNHAVEDKADATPVTAIDKAINESFRVWATEHGLGFIGEEGNGIEGAEFSLYLDPLDGTGAFARGMATATTTATIMSADSYSGRPEMAVIHNPITGQTWKASRGNGSFASIRNSIWFPSRVIPVPRNGKFLTAICAWPGVDERFATFNRKVVASRNFDDQQMGAFGLGGGLIASGHIHATAISATSAVETAAMSLIVREAGGVALDLRGTKIDHFEVGTHKGKTDFLLPYGAVLAASKEIADKLLELY